ncbi:tryptophan-rich sensory protein [Candidatus Saccharibacteria bacterium]|nr:tryptophan-rich sensory protein [Candidatus Saccharibacteria bacterium]
MVKTKKKVSTFSKVWRIALCILVPLGGGLIISMFTRDTMEKFGSFNQPPLAPPAWLFPVAWTILYILMGVASYLFYAKYRDGKKAEKSLTKAGLIVYGIQLALNFIWTPLFFTGGLYWVAFAVLALMWIAEIVLLVLSFKTSRAAFWCLLPYLLWTTFAGYLNIGIAVLN